MVAREVEPPPHPPFAGGISVLPLHLGDPLKPLLVTLQAQRHQEEPCPHWPAFVPGRTPPPEACALCPGCRPSSGDHRPAVHPDAHVPGPGQPLGPRQPPENQPRAEGAGTHRPRRAPGRSPPSAYLPAYTCSWVGSLQGETSGWPEGLKDGPCPLPPALPPHRGPGALGSLDEGEQVKILGQAPTFLPTNLASDPHADGPRAWVPAGGLSPLWLCGAAESFQEVAGVKCVLQKSPNRRQSETRVGQAGWGVSSPW